MSGPRNERKRMSRYFLVVIAIFSLSCTGGCSLPWSTPTYESYRPVIGDLGVYPGMRTREKFYLDAENFWECAKTTKPPAEDLLQWTYDLDTVLDAREKQIGAYNTWARDQNEKNGYNQKEF